MIGLGSAQRIPEYKSPVKRLKKEQGSASKKLPTPISPWKKVQSLGAAQYTGTIGLQERVAGTVLQSFSAGVNEAKYVGPPGGKKVPASPIQRVKSTDFHIQTLDKKGMSAILSPKGRKLFQFAPSPKRGKSVGEWRHV